ncbi:hypothetical protein BDQ12DRAFT_76538 [Crucibulum laeve]|uniref:F-box domain-containing protein n=1 Tax=Crucibulum laeve TaxID=68775 RepID=A0A5C3M1N7_9AGAR|nr:hypothetical protein BDQ12DRAFT_76538 [Crucibulum laeve]
MDLKEDIQNYNLPQELIDTVISYLRDDHPSLRICSHTARILRIRCQQYLFEKVIIQDIEASQRLCEVLMTSSHLSAYIIHMEINGSSGRHHSHWIYEDSGLSLVLDSIRHLQVLDLNGNPSERGQWSIGWLKLPTKLQFAIKSTLELNPISELAIRGFSDVPRSILHQLSVLKKLVLDMTHFGIEIESESLQKTLDISRSKTLLENFGYISPMTDNCILEWLCTTDSPIDISQLHTLSMGMKELHDYNDVALLLRLNFQTLQHFTFGLASVMPQSVETEPVDLGILSSLRTLSLHAVLFESPGGLFHNPPMQWITDCLKRIAEPNLVETVTFVVQISLFGPISAPFQCAAIFKEIASALMIMPHLRMATFRIKNLGNRMRFQQFSSTIEEELSWLRLKGMLHIEEKIFFKQDFLSSK